MKKMRKMKTSSYYDGQNKNFFNIEKEFFIIDSEKLADVRTRFYGYSVRAGGIFEEGNLTEDAVTGLDGCGAYIYVERQQGKIKIQQDYNGSWGIYIYRTENRFVLSNSFFRLMDYIKRDVPLSLDRDYSNHILLDNLASHSYSETPVNEIKLLDKDLVITIDIVAKNLNFEMIEREEDSYSLDSGEGMDLLDGWFRKWTTILRNLQKHTSQISAELSGGIDSRTTFLLLLKSGLDLNEISINSFNDKLHTHEEDYKIASQIAEHYGFKLNNGESLDETALHYSLQDIINLSFYTKMAFHKQMYFKHNKFAKKRYIIPGAGGESIRAHWDMSPQKFGDQMAGNRNHYSRALAKELGDSARKILQKAYRAIEEKHHIGDPESIKFPLNIYRETRCRNHFGKAHVESYFSNTFTLAPLIDPQLRKINLSVPGCRDNNLLMAVIYMRYCPELLNFKFEGNRTIDENTIRIAQELSDKYPRQETELPDEPFSVITEDRKVLDIVERGENNQEIPAEIPGNYLREVFDSAPFRKLFVTCFNDELYVYAGKWAKKHGHHPLRHCYSIIGIVRVIQDIMCAKRARSTSVIESMDKFISADYYDFMLAVRLKIQLRRAMERLTDNIVTLKNSVFSERGRQG